MPHHTGATSGSPVFKIAAIGALREYPALVLLIQDILLMVAQVYTILERVVRKNLENPDEKPVEGLNRQKTKRPTAYAIEYVLSGILVIRVQKKK